MTAPSVFTDSGRRPSTARSTVDVFGVRWPRHKAEAVLAAVVVLALMLLLSAAVGLPGAAPAVLVAAGAGTVVWWLGRLTPRS